jgi:dihydroneopterin aldolase
VRDRVFVRDLRVPTVIGVRAKERRVPQTVLVDVEIACDAARAAKDDDLSESVDYAAVARRIRAFGAKSRFRLVETFAHRLAKHLRADPAVEWLRLRIRKPGAVTHAGDVGVEIERGA